jgi:cysteinyl-tRNA synthetase
MGTKYLGEVFDIHGGGMDLLFPHHECEIAQSQVANGKESVRYWMHNNMITINGQKMGKSLGNFITLEEFFTGSNVNLTQAYSPMTIRFFILQAHYRSTLDFSNEALLAAEKGLKKLIAGYETLERLMPSPPAPLPGGEGSGLYQEGRVAALVQGCYDALNDDFNSPIVIAQLFEAVRIINSVQDKKETLTDSELLSLKNMFDTFLFDILGVNNEKSGDQREVIDGLMELIISIRQKSRISKDWGTSDQIRDALQKLNIVVKDGKEGTTWGVG